MTDLFRHFMDEALSIPDPYPETPKRSVNHSSAPEVQAPQPVASLSDNELRPRTFDDVIGQARTKALLQRIVRSAKMRGEPLDHMLLVGPSGMGKTTLACVVANAMGSQVYIVEAPIQYETLLGLREVMRDGDILFVDEAHQMAIQERRGKTASTQPESLFPIMEDRQMPTPTGVLPFPKITVIAATTDEGMLPDAFINRFPLRPVLEPYEREDMMTIARGNAAALKIGITTDAAGVFADASREIPRQVNNYIRNAVSLATGGTISADLAREVVSELCHTSPDGLTLDMSNLLTFLYTRCAQHRPDGTVVYRAGVGTIATALGKSRDQRSVALRIEPTLIVRGLLQVGHGGRSLTERGILRAQELIANGVRT